MTHIEAMKQALEYVQEFKSLWWKVPTFADRVNKATREAISFAHNPIFQLEDVLRQAIAEAEKQEPVAWPHKYGCRANAFGKCDMGCTTPPQRKPLTDEELEAMAENHVTNCYFDTLKFARAIEAAHNIKENT